MKWRAAVKVYPDGRTGRLIVNYSHYDDTVWKEAVAKWEGCIDGDKGHWYFVEVEE